MKSPSAFFFHHEIQSVKRSESRLVCYFLPLSDHGRHHQSIPVFLSESGYDLGIFFLYLNFLLLPSLPLLLLFLFFLLLAILFFFIFIF